MRWNHKVPSRQFRFVVLLLAAACLVPIATLAQNSSARPIELTADLSAAPSHVFHASLKIPASPGALTLVYPKWIPGEHGPTGPIADLTGLKITAAGKPLAWQRDLADMFAFHCVVPPGADSIDVELDYLSPVSEGQFSASPAATAKIAVLNWNTVLVYPLGPAASVIRVAPRLRLPAGWKYGTPLHAASESGEEIHFADVSLEMLVDSPVLAGEYLRTIPLSSGSGPEHFLHIAGDSAGAIEMPESMQAAYRQLVKETFALFGARHYTSYHFLLALSDLFSNFGLEHHESSDNRIGEKAMRDASIQLQSADLLPHEFVHSWNGKFRRPAGLATPDYQSVMKTDLVWVYEGLTQYLGEVLAARSGLIKPEESRERLARVAAYLDRQAGRTWRPLEDTAVAAQILYGARKDGESWRRSVDFYDESTLIWLEADIIIRQRTEGRRSLDDFCRKFYGPPDTPPMAKPYMLDDVIATLNEVAAYDWRGFFDARVYQVRPRAPLTGIEGSGWKLMYNESPNAAVRAFEAVDEQVDLRYSLGMVLKDSGSVADVIPGMTAARAGLAAGMRIAAVNSRPWSPEAMREALRRSRDASSPLELLVESAGYFRTIRPNYNGGDRQPHLEREASRPDVLSEILKPKASR